MSEPGLRPAFVLHRRPYRETSLLVELLTRDEGRIGVVARGARKRRGQEPLEPFIELLARWDGRGDLGRLHLAEPAGTPPRLKGAALYSAFYVNELVLRMLRRHDPHPEVYTCYAATLAALAARGDEAGVEVALRLFECRLLEACGYGLETRFEAGSGKPLEPDVLYRYEPEHGPVAVADVACSGLLVHGRALQALASGSQIRREDLHELKGLLRGLLTPHLGTRPLASRALFGAAQRRPATASDGVT